MGSRLRDHPDHLFEVFTEVARPGKPGEAAFILQKYPEEFDDQKALESEIPKFSFPGETESSAVENFSFVLTKEDGTFRFGFCRHAAGSHTCLCIVSYLPWYEVFYRLLNFLAEILNRSDSNSVTPLLECLYDHNVPAPGERVDLSIESVIETFTFEGPDPSQLPSIPQNRNLTEYYNAVDPQTMMTVFAAMLLERRILLTSRKLSRLTSCIHGAASLLYPMCWQHIYIPVLPPHLVDYCSAPMPYLIGVHSTLFQKLRSAEVGDAVIVDVDASTVNSDFNDLENLPGDVLSSLKKKLKAQSAEKLSVSPLGDGVSRAFLSANVALIGGYRQALRFPPGERITFDEDAFLHSRPPHMQPFLQDILHAQTFEQFINERLDKLIAGEGFSDEFDNEVNLDQDKWATQSRYREWYGQVKKQGKRFRKDGREKWVEITSKANPAMRGAMKAVRDKSKKAVKDIRHKFDELRKEDQQKPGDPRQRPQTIFSPELKTQRPPRPPVADHSKVLGPTPMPRQSVLRTASYERARQYKVISLDDLDDPGPVSMTRPRSPPITAQGSLRQSATPLGRLSRHSRRLPSEDTDIIADMTFQRVSLDLLGDQDIQMMLKKSYSLEDLTAMREIDEDDEDDDDDDEISYSSLRAAARESPPGGETSPLVERRDGDDHGLDTLIILDDNQPSIQDINANVSSRTTQNLSPPSSSESARKSQITQNSSSSSLAGSVVSNDSSGQTLNKEQSTPVAPKRRPRKIDSEKNNESPNKNLAFEDNFAPPIPPKVPLQHTKSIDEPSSPTTTGNPGDPPVPRRRTSINRKPAFYNEQRPQSFRRSSLVSEGKVDARTAFIHKPGAPPPPSGLDEFDPLVTGQLALDAKGPGNKLQEDDLLKEWNLNFSTRSPAPPRPPQPAPQAVGPMYLSSPALNQSPCNAYGAAYPRYPATGPPKWPSRGVCPQTQPSVHALIQQFSPSQSRTSATLGSQSRTSTALGGQSRPPQVVMRDSRVAVGDRPVSMYTDSRPYGLSQSLQPGKLTNGNTQPPVTLATTTATVTRAAPRSTAKTWETFD